MTASLPSTLSHKGYKSLQDESDELWFSSLLTKVLKYLVKKFSDVPLSIAPLLKVSVAKLPNGGSQKLIIIN